MTLPELTAVATALQARLQARTPRDTADGTTQVLTDALGVCADVLRLRAGLADLYLLHHWWGDGTGPHPCRALIGQGCQCGADAHNARIAALLGETDGPA